MPAAGSTRPRPRSHRVLRWAWVGIMLLTAASLLPEYVERGAPFAPARALAFLAVLLVWGLLVLLLLAAVGSLFSWSWSWGGWWWQWSGGHRGSHGSSGNAPGRGRRSGHEHEPTGHRWSGHDGVVRGRATALPVRELTVEEHVLAPAHADRSADARLLVVAERRVHRGERLRLDWDAAGADRVLLDGVPHPTSGSVDITVDQSRDVHVQALLGDRLLRSVALPVTVLDPPTQRDLFETGATALDRAVAQRPLLPSPAPGPLRPVTAPASPVRS